MTMRADDPPELVKAIEMLRNIYWREYGRGWREAVAQVKKVLEQPPVFIEGYFTDRVNAGDRIDPASGNVITVGEGGESK